MEKILMLDNVFETIIFEVSRYRSDILKNMEVSFSKLKKDNKSLEAKKELVNSVKQFTDVVTVTFTLKKEYFNAAVIPIYTQAISTDLINLFKDYESNDNIKTLKVVEEPSKYIKKIHIIIGYELLEFLSARELTAVVLHELGHVYTFTSNIPRFIINIFSKILGFTSEVLSVPFWLTFISVPIYVSSLLILVSLTRTLNFLDHKGEYKADQFAAKYGYGDEIIKVLYRLHKQSMTNESKQSWWKKIILFIKEIFNPSEHPKSSKRIEELSDQMVKEYKAMYPKLSNELSIILQDIKS